MLLLLFAVAMLRKAMVDVTLRDGTVIPAGTIVATSQYAIHHDPRHYDRPDAFDPSRWETASGADADGARKTFVTTSDDYIPWGNGKYSWCVGSSCCVRVEVGVDALTSCPCRV